MKKVLLTTAMVGISWTLPAAAATVTGWNTDNVDVGVTPVDGVTGASDQLPFASVSRPATKVSFVVYRPLPSTSR